MTPNRPNQPPSPLREALWRQRPLFIAAAWFGLVNGVLFLAPQWYMFEVYGRVLNSRNVNTLLMLLVMVIGVYVLMELVDITRAKILARAGEAIDAMLQPRLFDLAFDANLKRIPGGSAQVFNDLKTVREFVSSQAVQSTLDIPAAIAYMLMMTALSPWLGLMVLTGALIQALMAWGTERHTMPQLNAATRDNLQAQGFVSSALRSSQVLQAMGMLGSIRAKWRERHGRFLARQADASDYAGMTAVTAKLVQTMQGSLLLGAACAIFLGGGLWGGSGMMLMASILGARALAPLAQLVGQWRAVIQARDAYKRLDAVMSIPIARNAGMQLPRPQGVLQVEGVTAGPPGGQAAILRGVTFNVQPGEMLVVAGPTGAGKTTLARLLIGLWPAFGGKVRLDGADIHAWNKADLGPHIGYLPQSIELFDGTLAENIARFGDVDLEQVRRAAEQVGLGPVIADLPDGLETRIGEEGAILSGGTRQRVALARAIYGQPQLIVLDEPNASLDESGEADLMTTLLQLKAAKATIVVISHRRSLLPAADKLLVLAEGQVAAFGPRDDVLAALKKQAEQARAATQQRQLAPRGQPQAAGGTP